jgi:uncharacterized membrane protein YfcA
MSLAQLLPDGVDELTLLALIAFALIASIARGFSGFGGALIFMPLASTVILPRTAAVMLMLVDLVAAAPLIPPAWRSAQRKPVAWMALGGLFGVPLGAYALLSFDPLLTRWIICLFVLALLMLLMSGWRYRGPDHAAITAGVGGLSGFLGGLAQSGGPPIVAYWLGRPVGASVIRANIVLYFAATSIFAFASYFVGGLLTRDVVMLSLLIGPVYALGLFIGARLFGVASDTLFRRICYTLIALAGIVGLPLLDPWLRP